MLALGEVEIHGALQVGFGHLDGRFSYWLIDVRMFRMSDG